jgi:hypothetical protein
MLPPSTPATVETFASEKELKSENFVTASVADVRLEEDPGTPHVNTVSDGFESDILHFTQDDIVKDEEPIGREGRSAVDKHDLLDIFSASLG